MSKHVHWVDKLADELEQRLRKRNKQVYVFNGGLSVSGVQHIGRLRGEILLPETLRRILEKRGLKIKQLLTLYTQDPWKGKASQRSAFKDPDKAKEYTGRPLVSVPDPYGCHENWVEHYWSDFGPYLSEFTDGKIEVVTTTDLYRSKFRDFIMNVVLPKKDEFRNVINKYRGRKPYPEDWIPVEPICEKCGRIDKTVAISVEENGRVRYRCKYCGHEGVTDVSNSKLNWRIEWAGIWYILGVDFEPYGKDHATPGGSRDSCVDLAVNVIGFQPPEGEWYEWVSIREKGQSRDMTSSGFVGITPKEWLEIAHPQILRFLYFFTHPHKKLIVDLDQIPQYYESYYRAERIYFGIESLNDKEQEEYLKRTYELSHPREPPEKLPLQVPYTHASILAQLVGPTNIEEAVERLKKTGHIKEDLDNYSRGWLQSLLIRSYNWVEKYGGERYRVQILANVPGELLNSLEYRELLCQLGEELDKLSEWTEEKIKDTMISVTSSINSGERKRFYREFYLLFTGRNSGPRAAPLLSLLKKDFVIARLRLACK